jgi:hypothetical protein
MSEATRAAGLTWREANHQFLRRELERLRLLLSRHAHRMRGEVSEADILDARIAAEGQELERWAVRFAEVGRPPAIDVLAHLFGLAPLERDLLLLAAAPELDSTFDALFARAHGETRLPFPTSRLAVELFGAGEGWMAARESLMRHAPLRRFALLHLPAALHDTGLAALTPLRLDERLLSFLLGANEMAPGLATLLRAVAPEPLAPGRAELAAQVAAWARAGGGGKPWPLVNLVGQPGAGRRALARAVCEHLGVGCFELDVGAVAGSAVERAELLRLVERESVLLQFAVFMDATRSPHPGAGSHTPGAALIEDLGVLLFVASADPRPTVREAAVVRLDRPAAPARAALWTGALQTAGWHLNGRVAELAHQFDFGPSEIVQAIGGARARNRLADPGEPPSADDLWQSCREQVAWRLDELAQRITPRHVWDDLVLPADLLSQLREVAAQVANRGTVYDDWGFGAKLSRGAGISALFAGPSGTGKTLAAEILAAELRLDLYRIDLAGVVSKYIGETEKNLRGVFDAAERSGAILFFDEADALFGKRSEVKDSHDRYANIEVSYLLQRMEEYRGLAILATNLRSHLDHAFLRRLRFVLEFPFPEVPQRLLIWQKAFPAAAAREGLDFGQLARLELAGGSIHNVALNAAFLAATANEPIRMAHVLHATRREYVKMDKLLPEAGLAGALLAGAR